MLFLVLLQCGSTDAIGRAAATSHLQQECTTDKLSRENARGDYLCGHNFLIIVAMIGAILGAATSIGSSIYGGIKAHKAEKKYRKEMADLNKKQNDWYNQRMNEDYTQRADVQRLLNSSREAAERQINSARARQAVSGGTDESVMAAQESANAGLADATAQIASQAGAYKDAVDKQNQQNISANAARNMQYYAQAAQNAQTAASAGMQAGMGVVGADMQAKLNNGKGLFEGLFKKK